jgi:hypothetical protein
LVIFRKAQEHLSIFLFKFFIGNFQIKSLSALAIANLCSLLQDNSTKAIAKIENVFS